MRIGQALYVMEDRIPAEFRRAFVPRKALTENCRRTPCHWPPKKVHGCSTPSYNKVTTWRQRFAEFTETPAVAIGRASGRCTRPPPPPKCGSDRRESGRQNPVPGATSA